MTTNSEKPLATEKPIHIGGSPKPCTKEQARYINILFSQCEMTEAGGVSWLRVKFSRSIQAIQDLDNYEAGNAIEHLKQIKRSMRRH